MFSLAEKKSDKILARNTTTETERDMKEVRKNLEKVQQLKYAVLEKIVGGDEELENLEEWSIKLEEEGSLDT